MKHTVRVRIAVAVDHGGEWNAFGWGGREQAAGSEPMSMARAAVGMDAAEYWIEAELPVPAPHSSSGTAEIVQGNVVSPDPWTGASTPG